MPITRYYLLLLSPLFALFVETQAVAEKVRTAVPGLNLNYLSI